MKQDGTAGTPRLPTGPSDEAPSFQFKTETQAFEYILNRGRTKEQVTALVAAAQMGMAISEVMASLKETLWVVQERGPVARTEVADWTGDQTFVRVPPKEFPPGLNAVVTFADFAIEMVDATRHVIKLAKRLRDTLDQNPALIESLNHWTSELQMATAFTLHAAQTMELNPKLAHREMEAVALLIGYREAKVEFALATDRQEDNWRKLIEKVQTKLLPALRSLTTPRELPPTPTTVP